MFNKPETLLNILLLVMAVSASICLYIRYEPYSNAKLFTCDGIPYTTSQVKRHNSTLIIKLDNGDTKVCSNYIIKHK